MFYTSIYRTSLNNVFVISIPASYSYFAFLYKQRYIIIFTLRTFILFFYILGLNFNNYIFTNQRQKAEKRDKKISFPDHPEGRHGI